MEPMLELDTIEALDSGPAAAATVRSHLCGVSEEGSTHGYEGTRLPRSGAKALGRTTFLRLLQGHQLDADRFVTHRFPLSDFEHAYDVFADAANTGALKVCLTRQ